MRNEALDSAATQVQNGARDKKLAQKLKSLAAGLKGDGDDAIVTRQRAGLAETLRGIAAELR